ncbi:DoxX-like family protein [Tenacibaculum geojense]|uniref:DoxX-like family protein n=1 Tax=Tenacibaculum geojense TaxID=915352 RepID=A0ABW3JT76_9FLAO
MRYKIVYKIIKLISVLVWFVNGIYCKILDQVPRHQEIVKKIINEEYSGELTLIIGLLEVVMVVWILSNYKSRLNVIIQITVVMIMNIVELLLVRDLLLWGKYNVVFAILFTVILYINEFQLKSKLTKYVTIT